MKINSTNVLLVSIVIMLFFLDSRYMPGANIAVIFLLINLVKNSKIKFKLGTSMKIFSVYILYLLAITVLHIRSNFDINNSIIYFIEILIILLSIISAFYNINLISLMKLIRYLGISLGVLGIIEGIVKYPFLAYLLNKPCDIAFDPSGYRIVSIFAHPIVAGDFFLFIWCALLIVPSYKFIINFISHIIIITAIVLTRSRSVWLGACIFGVLLLIKKITLYGKVIPKKIINRFITILAMFFGVNLLSGFNLFKNIYSYFCSRIIGSLYAGNGGGNIIRIDTVLNSINYWKDGNLNKFIFGMGKNYDKYFMTLFPVKKYLVVWTAAIDNQYFTTIHECGIIGLIFIIMILILAIKRLVKSKSNNNLIIVSNAGIVGIFVSLYFFEGLNYMSILTILIVLILISDNYEE